ncbi:2-polyprenylphenol hydroxylase and related flavodoxin oxidoreductases / CDP-6-deoxy-delta-3,4-glucoseen reductase-like [hydrothermal vent metagenome]|uniref:2-polyprenylphenol hydroxylase and related flavodoxin oxidoreductases / CDP-6-deoxy-delta-3,4-glucoseen reductase-like n=1 Tax=hydrothermal vent metagenome TaxID=652676 RepID=A0A3B0ZKS7_9ZZZZ
MGFKIVISPVGKTFEAEEGESILDAALRHGVSLSYGCRNAVCGACKGKLVSGEVSYEDLEPAALSEAEKSAGMILFCGAEPRSDVTIAVDEIASSEEISVKQYPVRVVKLDKLAPDVMRVYLKLPDSSRMQFLAGQYIDILLRDGRRRSFSLANAPHDDALIELHIRYIDGGEFTDHVFRDMKEKEMLRIEGPLGGFFLREESPRPMIFVAGGTGFAPVKGIIEHALAENIDRPVHLYWGARAEVDLYLNELPKEWAERGVVNYVPVLSDANESDQWQGRDGYVHQAVLNDFPDLSGYDVYAGGPPVMVSAARDAFSAQGLSEENFFYDAFEFSKKPAASEG